VKRRILALLASLGLLVLGAVPAGAQEGTTRVQIREVNTDSFPVLSVTFSVAGEEAPATDEIALTENRRDVADPSVASLATEGLGIDVVLAIDTSESMQGAPLASAIAAANAFLGAAGPDVSVGIVTFDSDTQVLHAIEESREEAGPKIDSLLASGETSLYDGVIAAARAFSGAGQRNILLLSDGGDTSSQATIDDALRAAKQAGAAIISVGLKSSEVNVGPSPGRHQRHGALKRLATGTNGRYTTANEAELTGVYQQILTTLTQQYVITYESRAARGSEISITVTTPQGSDSITILAPQPAAPTAPPSPQVNQPEAPGLFGSGWALGVVLGFVFLAAFVFLMMMLGPAAQARREREIQRRVSIQPVSETEEPRGDRGLSSWLPSLVAAGDRLANAGGFTLWLERWLELAGIPLTPGEIVAGGVITTFVGAVVGGLVFQSWLFAAIFAVLGALFPIGYLAYRSRQRVKKLHEQLPDVLMILASSLRAGHSFLQAIDTVSKEVADPSAKEFNRVVTEIRLGRPVEEAMNAMADRINSEDMRWAILAVNIQREVGGNLAEVLDTVAETVRDRDQIRRQVDVLSIEGKLSMYILIGLPIGVGLYIFRFNREYIMQLFQSTQGWFMFGIGAVLMAVGFFWMRKIVKVDV
jgi:tight adherence protein B